MATNPLRVMEEPLESMDIRTTRSRGVMRSMVNEWGLVATA